MEGIRERIGGERFSLHFEDNCIQYTGIARRIPFCLSFHLPAQQVLNGKSIRRESGTGTGTEATGIEIGIVGAVVTTAGGASRLDTTCDNRKRASACPIQPLQ
ncbi:hypothetical protein KQX54_020289 [Cotesia glomerata]|uniref:Uncharacterized protein n=1 Tax=Cotesia glomerata TaxID=32391 RepID=A0AAV7I510_COTGL|nr:hypothetical protein KQX54_020289 [Cotesia glomerata]